MARINNTEGKKSRLIAKYECVCQGCFKDFTPDELTLDHIRPASDGGKGSFDNLTLLCRKCNKIKGSDLTLTGLRRKNLGDPRCLTRSMATDRQRKLAKKLGIQLAKAKKSVLK